MAVATPLIILPDMSDADIDREWEAMIERSQITRDFLSGKIGVADFFDYLDEDDIDIPDFVENWEANLDLIYSCA